MIKSSSSRLRLCENKARVRRKNLNWHFNFKFSFETSTWNSKTAHNTIYCQYTTDIQTNENVNSQPCLIHAVNQFKFRNDHFPFNLKPFNITFEMVVYFSVLPVLVWPNRIFTREICPIERFERFEWFVCDKNKHVHAVRSKSCWQLSDTFKFGEIFSKL